jgi:hypothetical protein
MFEAKGIAAGPHTHHQHFKSTERFGRNSFVFTANPDAFIRERSSICARLLNAQALRKHYHGLGCLEPIASYHAPKIQLADSEDEFHLEVIDGVVNAAPGASATLHRNPGATAAPTWGRKRVPTLEQFKQDYGDVVSALTEGPLRSFAHERLSILAHSFDMHITLNHRQEEHDQATTRTDFFHVAKVCFLGRGKGRVEIQLVTRSCRTSSGNPAVQSARQRKI